MNKIYTSKGDDGFTGMLGEGRIPKFHPRIETVGSLDEASAALGMARALANNSTSAQVLVEAQRHLYQIMAEISATPENAATFHSITPEIVTSLESKIDQISTSITLPKQFIVPGDSPAGAALALSRAIVRRAERQVAKLLHENEIQNNEILRYLNRLSSLCFVLELLENQTTGKDSPTLARPDL